MILLTFYHKGIRLYEVFHFAFKNSSILSSGFGQIVLNSRSGVKEATSTFRQDELRLRALLLMVRRHGQFLLNWVVKIYKEDRPIDPLQ